MLKDIVIKSKVIKVDSDQSFQVKGLTITDLGQLIEGYKEPLGALMESRLDLNSISKEYPEFMAKVIAHGAGEPEAHDKIMSMPFSVQLFAFEACWDLTIPDYEALGKLVERIKGIIPKLQGKQE